MTTATKAQKAVSSVSVSSLIDRGVQDLPAGTKLVNDSGLSEFKPFVPVLLPANNHDSTFSGKTLTKLNKNAEVMTFAFFSVKEYGEIATSVTIDFLNNLVRGERYILVCGEPKGGYSTVKEIKKA